MGGSGLVDGLRVSIPPDATTPNKAINLLVLVVQLAHSSGKQLSIFVHVAWKITPR